MRAVKYLCIAAVAVFVAYHFYPSQTVKAGKSLADKSVRASKELAK